MRYLLYRKVKGYTGIIAFFTLFFNPGHLFSLTIDEVARELMSPPCNYLMTLETCKTGEAKELRILVKNMIDSGMTKEEIKAYFVKEYGEKVLGAPPQKGFNLLAYYLPYLIVIDALLILSLVLIIWTRKKGGLYEGREMPVGEEDLRYGEKVERDIESLKDS